MIFFEMAAGLVLLFASAEVLVRGAVTIARRLGLSPLLIGLTLVGFGTSSPELLASLTAALEGSPGIALGNVVGSNICNILLILGATAVLSPLATRRGAVGRDIAVLLATSVALVVICLLGRIGRLEGAAFVAALVAYISCAYRQEVGRRVPSAELHRAEAREVPSLHRRLPTALALTALGLLGLSGGAYLLVNAAIALARQYGLSETVIGLTLVAIGTALPELATSVVAALHRHPDVALGNVLGSNIYNILGIAGTTALVQPIAVPAEIARTDVWVMLASTLVLTALVHFRQGIARWQGGLLLLAYVCYLGLLAAAAATTGGD